jgi:hypothetical protein
MSAVNIKTPAFSESSPGTWFVILEAQFHNLNISTPKTKFYHALANLPVQTVQRISTTILNSEDFDKLKNSIVENYEATKPELFESLLSKTTYSGRPSAFLSEIRQIADKVGVTDDLVRHKFTQSLPSSMRAVLAAQDLPLDKIGKLADELLPLCETSVSAVDRSYAYQSRNHSPERHYDQSSYNTDRKSNNVAKYSRPCETPQQHQGLQPFHSNQRQKICRAHIFYADNARSCRSWCMYPNKGKAQIQPPSGRVSRSGSPVPLNR